MCSFLLVVQDTSPGHVLEQGTWLHSLSLSKVLHFSHSLSARHSPARLSLSKALHFHWTLFILEQGTSLYSLVLEQVISPNSCPWATYFTHLFCSLNKHFTYPFVLEQGNSPIIWSLSNTLHFCIWASQGLPQLFLSLSKTRHFKTLLSLSKTLVLEHLTLLYYPWEWHFILCCPRARHFTHLFCPWARHFAKLFCPRARQSLNSEPWSR
jgi:hypothetical protein